MRRYSAYVPAADRRSPSAAGHGWYAAVTLGALALALALGLVARHWLKPRPRVNGVPDWVYRAFAPQASEPPVS